MKRQQRNSNPEDSPNHKGRAYLKAVQSDRLARLQDNLDKDNAEIPLGVDEAVARNNRESLRNRISEQIVRAITALQSMAKTSAPHIRRFYEDVLLKKVFTTQNLKHLVEQGKRSWGLLTMVYHWLEEQWQKHPGMVGALVGAGVGLKFSGSVAAVLGAIPFIGQALASIATLVGVAGGVYVGIKLSMNLHEDYCRNAQLLYQTSQASQTQIVEQVVEKLEAILAHPRFGTLVSQ